ncbi:Acg family FMN-binding oxidoreductase [Litoreibacter roseus]|uniref:Nitroreductase family protein n=1 Tax=Litoreibacter roseus TaxID=2601869 RepID=A0A6N6JB68_9RHOB|nr:twin-arginine translocation pathway signal protein [Litoreibacter roseus]GFE63110.1 hypothetical protein KIN_01840 [Litoreibacter roseus]
MTLSRRKTLALIGGGTIFAAGAASAGFIMTRTPSKALSPWADAGTYDDPRLRALSYALLAPNPHNRQPWEAELIGDNQVAIYRDPTRNLPVTDPFARQLTIGMGCFLELMKLAAAEEGFDVEMTLFPEWEANQVALCTFIPNAAKSDPLFAHVMERRSHKDMFDPRTIEADKEKQLAAYATIYTDPENVAALKEIGVEAWLIEANTQDAWQESIDLFRIGKSEINAQPDGIDLGGPMLEALNKVGLFTREVAADLENPGTQAAVQDMVDAVNQAPAFVVQTTQGNTQENQIEAGQQWLRLNLATTSLGLALRPISQALQEYPEMEGPYKAIHEKFAEDGETVQMLGLLGYGQLTPRTPRWPLETRLRNG